MEDVEAAIDLFDPPLHIRHLRSCVAVRDEHPPTSLKQIAARLGINHMIVKRDLVYAADGDRGTYGALPRTTVRSWRCLAVAIGERCPAASHAAPLMERDWPSLKLPSASLDLASSSLGVRALSTLAWLPPKGPLPSALAAGGRGPFGIFLANFGKSAAPPCNPRPSTAPKSCPFLSVTPSINDGSSTIFEEAGRCHWHLLT